MKRLVPILAALLLAGCGGADSITVRDAVVTVPPVPDQAGAAYFTVEARGQADRLIGVESARAERIEFHQTVNDNGVSRMLPLPSGGLEVASGRPLVFEPGARHGMVFGLDSALKPGDRIALTFRFEAGGPVTAEAEVRGPGQAHAGH